MLSAENVRLMAATCKHIADTLLKKALSAIAKSVRSLHWKGQQRLCHAAVVRHLRPLKLFISGRAVLAHPHACKMSNKWLRRLLVGEGVGLDGKSV